MFDRFTDRAKRVLGYARKEADLLKSRSLGTEHVLLGLIREGSGVTGSIMRGLGLELDRMREEVEKRADGSPFAGMGSESTLSGNLRKALDHAISAADGRGDASVDAEHLLLGLIKEQPGMGAQIMLGMDLSLATIRDDVLAALGDGGGAAPARGKARENLPASEPLHNTGSRERLTFTERALKALEYADEQARREGAERVDAHHLRRGAERAEAE